MKWFLNNSCFLDAKLGFIEPLRWPTIEVFIVFLIVCRIVVVLVAIICISCILLPFCFRTACLSVTSHASAYLGLCQRGNLLNKTVNHLQCTRNDVEHKQEAGNECWKYQVSSQDRMVGIPDYVIHILNIFSKVEHKDFWNFCNAKLLMHLLNVNIYSSKCPKVFK